MLRLYTIGDRWMKCLKHWWNNTDIGKPTYLGRSLSHCHSLQHTSHLDDRAGIKPGPLMWEASDFHHFIVPWFNTNIHELNYKFVFVNSVLSLCLTSKQHNNTTVVIIMDKLTKCLLFSHAYSSVMWLFSPLLPWQ